MSAPAPARRTAAIALCGLGIALVVTVALTTPWHPLPGPGLPAAPARDFTPAELARERAFAADLRPPGYLGLAAALLSIVILGLSPLGARLLGHVVGPARRWPLGVAAAAIVVTAVPRAAALPFDAWTETVLRRYGLSTQRWAGWAVDQLKSFAVAAVTWTVALLLLHLLVRRMPRHWWAPAAAGSFLLVVAISFGYPLVVEPVFNSFTPMRAGPLRTELLRLARDDGVPVRKVLVADASRRTTALNAYVSGFGSTRRIVVYDTLLRSASPGEIKLIVAHELGHAKRGDVLYGTLLGGLGVATGVCALYLLTTSPRVLRRAGVSSVADPRAVALVLALVTVGTQLAGPVQTLVSRRIEARADVHALDLTRDPRTFVRMQRALAVRNLSDLRPNPIEYALWATHPTGPQRIAMARAWARGHGMPS
ncbi:MAG TPA: M48 family metallopeptidase [Streptosporangiaceae bacterium]|nr:M48 family metallopeptidase [Streptosporangiaceae bacterium]